MGRARALFAHVSLAASLAFGCGSSDAESPNHADASAGAGGGAMASGGISASSGGASAGSGGATTAAGGSGASAGAAGTTSCAADPLHTGEATPAHVDDFDCEILAATKKYGEPDAMIFKAIIYAESRFAYDADACLNLPCGTPSGWTDAEAHCFGLMQIVPACGGTPGNEGLLPNGHPNLTTDQSVAGFATSIFNPAINIDVGVYGVSDNRKQVKQQFAGCTEDQYTLMAIGNYNSYGSTKSCTVYNTAYDDSVLTTYRKFSQDAGWAAHEY
jgi:hypothetical protein